MSSAIPPFLSPIQRLDTYFNTSKPLKSFTDADIENIATLLQRAGNPAHRTPRIYIILRVIDELPLLTQLIQTGFSDSWFPVSEQQLPKFLPQPTKKKITATQQIILTPSLDLENGKHCHFSSSSSEELPFSVLSCLGRGAYGQVDCIESKTSHKFYALKRIHRRTAFGKNAKQAMQDFQNEMLIMKTLHHKHTIRYIGSYTDLQNLGVLMSPVARCDLSSYMQHASRSRTRTPTDSEYPLQLLSTFMGCLAAALRYLHVNDVKHRDIKPQNILVDADDNVLIADFGLSRDFLDTTSGLTPASPRYCAPEVAAYEPRNMSADIWSLGCVFFEILAALRGFDGEWLKAYFRGVGSGSAKYHANTQATEMLLSEWEQGQDCGERETRPVGWIRRMLVVERRERASAEEVLDMIVRPVEEDSSKMFCGECCIPDGNSV